MNKRLRRVTSEDSKNLLRWRNAPDVRRFVFHQDVIAAGDHAMWFGRMLTDASSAFFIYDCNDKPFGVVGFTNIDRATGQADWGFYTVPDAPMGTGTAMLGMALSKAFGELNLNKVCAEVLDYNHASIRLHHKLGFTNLGLRHDPHLVDETFHDVIVFAKSKIIER